MNHLSLARARRAAASLAFLFSLALPALALAQEPDAPADATSPDAEAATTPPDSEDASESGDETEVGDEAEGGDEGGGDASVEPTDAVEAPPAKDGEGEVTDEEKKKFYDFDNDQIDGETPKPTSTDMTAQEAARADAKAAVNDAASEGKDASDTPRVRADEEANEEDIFGNVSSTFTFGSYGRVRAATDFDGGRARQNNVVSHGSRIDESNYAELEFQNLFEVPSSSTHKYYTQVVATLALGDDLFHFTGDFDQSLAVRNLYADAGWKRDALTLSFWGGSRMYRGDDIYLLDFWPLDNLNTVGGGLAAAYDISGIGRSELKLHAGASRLFNPYQFQVVQVPGFDFGAADVVFLNRQRGIMSARFQQDIWLSRREDGSPKAGAKVVLYGEKHDLPEAARLITETNEEEILPAEEGTRLGAELGVWTGDGFFKGSFANLFFARGKDLAAYGEFGIPSGVSPNETSEGAIERMFAASVDVETPFAGLLLGSYYKYFQDADRQDVDFDDYWEAIVAARMHVYATRHIHPGIEYSYQVRSPQGPFQGTNEYEVPTVSKFSVIQAISLDRSMYSRPQLRLIYTRSALNASAVALYPTDDPRREDFDAQSNRLVSHYGGVMVEWWFNNASLFRP